MAAGLGIVSNYVRALSAVKMKSRGRVYAVKVMK